MGMGKLEFREVIPNKSYAQPFIHVKITSSKTMRFITIISIGKEEKNFVYVVKQFNYKQTLKSSK